MHHQPLVSICIPAYNGLPFLKRLLESIARQTFTSFEVVITDDSPDENVGALVKQFESSLPIHYYKNPSPLGTPENWNEAIRHAKGTWIKLMHNDDWFRRQDSLKLFYEATIQHQNKDFFFSAFQNIEELSGKKEIVRCDRFDLWFLRQSPLHLFRKVYVGNPSCTMVKRSLNMYYEKKYKFVVDFEFYIRCFQGQTKWQYIDDVLVNIGFHSEQVTKYTFLVPDVQLPENHQLLKQLGAGILRNIFVYDYYWRMYRNLGIRTVSAIAEYDSYQPHPLIQQIIQAQQKLPKTLLNRGVISKSWMLLNYTISLFRPH